MTESAPPQKRPYWLPPVEWDGKKLGCPGGGHKLQPIFEQKELAPNAPEVCKLLRERMNALGMSVRQLSDVLPVKKSVVGQYLSGVTRIPEEYLPDVSRALKVDLASLVAAWDGDKEVLETLPDLPEGVDDSLEDLKDKALRDEATVRMRAFLAWCRGRLLDQDWSPQHRVNAAKLYLDALKHCRGESGGGDGGGREVRIYREMGPDRLREFIFQRIGGGK